VEKDSTTSPTIHPDFNISCKTTPSAKMCLLFLQIPMSQRRSVNVLIYFQNTSLFVLIIHYICYSLILQFKVVSFKIVHMEFSFPFFFLSSFFGSWYWGREGSRNLYISLTSTEHP
jgi:hypothetical protein